MKSELPRSELTIMTFADGEGKTHLALPLYEVIFRGETYSVALSSGAGLVVIRHAGEERIPVADASVVDAISAQMRTLQEQGGEPALHFQAQNAAGRSAPFRAIGVVSHQGKPYIVAEDSDGVAQVFRAPDVAGDAPDIVSDEAVQGRVLRIAEKEGGEPAADSSPSAFTLRMSDGATLHLQPERSVECDGEVYWLASDAEHSGRVYSLRQMPSGKWQPVTDAEEVERVRVALLQSG